MVRLGTDQVQQSWLESEKLWQTYLALWMAQFFYESRNRAHAKS